jgi:hypothetical protein
VWLHSDKQIHDRLKVHGRFANDHFVDPTTTVVGIRLINTPDGATIYNTTIPAGAAGWVKRETARKTVFIFKDVGASVNGGVFLFKMKKGRDWYRLTTKTYGDMSAANSHMTVEITFGPEQYTSTGTWTRKSASWYLNIK